MKHYTAISIPDSPDKPWRSLHIFNLYRLIMTGIIAVIFFFAEPGDTTLGSDLPTIFGYAIIIWIVISLANGFASRIRRPGFQLQVTVTIPVDIGFITLLMYTSGGMESGLGTLMLVTVAASGILLSGKKSFAFAALATLSILAMHSYSVLLERIHTAYGFTHIGLLGAGLFAVALLTHTLALRIKESEALASQRGAEIEDLSLINELIIQQMDIGVLVIAHDNKILLQNDSMLRILHTDTDIAGQSLALISPELNAQLQSWKENSITDSPPIRIGQGTNEVLPRFSRIGKITTGATAIFLEDTTQLAHQAQQVKLASLGRLTASIAHEIRNPLSAIHHAGQLLGESKNLPAQDLRLTEIIRKQAQRLDTVVENILSLSRKQSIAPEPLDISNWLERFTHNMVLEKQLKSGDVLLHLSDNSPNIRFDASHLEQILCNLCDNSIRHAQSKTNTDHYLDIYCSLNETSDQVEVDIVDTGPGISKDNQEKLFEPFFTTESTGTGLGLFVARELCELNHSHLSYIHSPDEGAHFRLNFPVRY